MTALYLTSLSLQTSASLRFLGTFISGALPVKLTTPLMVAVPILPSPPPCAGAAVFASAPVFASFASDGLSGFAAVVGFGAGPAFGSSGQPAPTVRANVMSAAAQARSRERITWEPP